MTVIKNSVMEVMSELTPYALGIALVILLITPFIF